MKNYRKMSRITGDMLKGLAVSLAVGSAHDTWASWLSHYVIDLSLRS